MASKRAPAQSSSSAAKENGKDVDVDEEEQTSLLNGGGGSSKSNTTTTKKKKKKKNDSSSTTTSSSSSCCCCTGKRPLVLLSLFVGSLALLRIFLRGEDGMSGIESILEAHHNMEKSTNIDMKVMVETIISKKLQFEARLRTEYGSHYETIFQRSDNNMGDTYEWTFESRERLKRRFMNKILSHGSDPTSMPTFIWATGGHSAAAGHGDLQYQAYTNVMVEYALNVFRGVGIKLIGKNYAMGGMSSAPELAFCMESVYGDDVDVLSWDFGMTDGRDNFRSELWVNRASIHPTRPFLILKDPSRYEIYQHIELTSGIGTAHIRSDRILADLKERLPDMGEDPTQSQDDVPESLKYLVCNSGLENGDPCGEYKFDSKLCTFTKFKTSWHPGWKIHKLDGLLMAKFLVDTLYEAIIDLERLFHPSPEVSENDDSTTATSTEGKTRTRTRRSLVADTTQTRSATDVQTQLDRLDKDDMRLMNDTTAIMDLKRFPNWQWVLGDDDDDGDEGGTTSSGAINATTLLRRHAICHTALLPSHARYEGLTTEKHGKGDWSTGGFDVGISLPENNKREPAGGTKDEPHPAQLVYNPEFYYGDGGCNFTYNIDHKDSFYIREEDGYTSMIVPTIREVEMYGTLNRVTQGIILLCPEVCDWGKCPKDRIQLEEFRPPSSSEKGNVTITVDGEPVVEVKEFDKCWFLRGEDGFRWGPGKKPNVGQYDVVVKPERKGGRLSITSVIVW